MINENSLLSTDKKRWVYRKYPLKKRHLFLLLPLLFLAIIEIIYSGNTFLFSSIFLLVLAKLWTKYRLLPDSIRRWIDPVWHPITRQLRYFHIRQIRGEQVPPLSTTEHICKNCGDAFTGNYCPRCGQTNKVRRFNAASIFSNILKAFSRLANGFRRTIVELLWRPGYMMADFIKGKRIRYVQPFQMLFLLAAFYVLMMQLVDPVSLQKENKKENQTEQQAKVTTPQVQGQDEKHEDSGFFHFAEALNIINKQIEEKAGFNTNNNVFPKYVLKLLQNWAHGNKAATILLTIPLFGVASRMVFCWKKFPAYNLTEHLFIQTFIACQLLLISILILPFTGKAWVDDLYDIPAEAIFLLFMWDYHELFCTSWWSSFWRTAQTVLYSLLILITTAAICVGLLFIYMEITGTHA